MRMPPTLAAGARIALVAPSGPLRSPDELDAAVANVTSFGWEAVAGEHVLARDGYFAGSDADRAADLNTALNDARIDGIWCVRGGYGAMRILESLDTDAMRSRPRALIGYSDITALHAAFGLSANVTGFHAPTARGRLSDFSRDSMKRGLVDRVDPCGPALRARTLRPGRASGVLVGGNLAILAALSGTRFAPDYSGAILVLEDVGEATYRIDRMLRQLALSGALSKLAGIAFGEFTDASSSTDATSRPLDDVLMEAAGIAGVPAIAGIPMGHIDDQWTLPLGATAELDADACELHVTF